MTLSDKLQLINTYKGDIRTSIANKGVDISSTTPLSEYSSKIDSISGSTSYTLNMDVTGTNPSITYNDIKISDIPVVPKANAPYQVTNLSTSSDYLISKDSIDINSYSNWTLCGRFKTKTGTEHTVLSLVNSDGSSFARFHLGNNGAWILGQVSVNGSESYVPYTSFGSDIIYECRMTYSNGVYQTVICTVTDSGFKTQVYNNGFSKDILPSGTYTIRFNSLGFGYPLSSEIIYPTYCYVVDNTTGNSLVSCIAEK